MWFEKKKKRKENKKTIVYCSWNQDRLVACKIQFASRLCILTLEVFRRLSSVILQTWLRLLAFRTQRLSRGLASGNIARKENGSQYFREWFMSAEYVCGLSLWFMNEVFLSMVYIFLFYLWFMSVVYVSPLLLWFMNVICE